MLCETCRTSLNGTSDPIRIPRLARVTHDQSSTSQYFEIESYVYGHHLTMESMMKSSEQGCDVCTLVVWDQKIRTIKTYETACNYGYFSTFRIAMKQESVIMYTKCLDLPEYDSTFVPVVADSGKSNVQYEVDNATDGLRTWNLLERWIQDCKISHDCAKSHTTFLPTRLVRVDYTQRPTSYQVVLRGECPEESTYAALSYIWGNQQADKTLRLLSSNMDHLRSPNSTNFLPKTFQDAIRVIERLGIQYLWIDRLCIVQDSDEDWRAEAGTMHDVYKNSALTISAFSSLNDNTGLFFQRNVDQIVPTVVHLRTSNSDQLAPYRHDGDNCRTYSILWHKEAETTKRGWCYQERVLSPRVVHFGRSQIYWECRQRNACEMHPNRAGRPITRSTFKRLLGGPMPDISADPYMALLQNWYTMIQMYSGTKLTYQSDRLIALAGLVNDLKCTLAELRPNMEHPFMVGLWGEDLRFGLCWERYFFSHDQFQDRPLNSKIPSWSWALGNLGGSYLMRDSVVAFFVAEHACKASVEYTGSDHTGDIMNASLNITGFWIGMRVCLQGKIPFERRYNARLVDHLHVPGSGDELETPLIQQGEIYFDFTDDMPERVFYIPIQASYRKAHDHILIEGLCLIEVNTDNRKDCLYRRVGLAALRYANIEVAHGFFSRFQEESIRVV